jgi:hypothetical protein
MRWFVVRAHFDGGDGFLIQVSMLAARTISPSSRDTTLDAPHWFSTDLAWPSKAIEVAVLSQSVSAL